MSSPASSARYAAIDALRGFAALWVAAFHFYNQIRSGDEMPWGRAIDFVLGHGYLGVFVFFVLSGFVIARNLHGLPVAMNVVGRFALRRSIRLDPTYWAIIFATLAMTAFKVRYGIGSDSTRMPSPATIAANCFYLDNLLGVDSIVAVGWTLCLEIQFYLALALLEWASHRSSIRFPLFAGVFAWSIVVALANATGLTGLRGTIPGLFIDYWYAFFFGVLSWWTVAGAVRVHWLLAAIGLRIAVDAVARIGWPNAVPIWPEDQNQAVGALTAAATAVAIVYLGRRNRLIDAFSGPIFQYFGRISYSLYLVHPLLGNRGLNYLLRYAGLDATLTRGMAVVYFAAALLISVAAAHVLYRLVELPSHRLSRKIKLQPASDGIPAKRSIG